MNEPPLRVTLTHFTLLSYERALRLPSSLPISGLSKLGVKTRLCRSSWRAFASTYPLILPTTSPREALPCLLFFCSVESSFLHGGVHPFLFMLLLGSPLSGQGAAFAHLDSLLLVIWCSGQTASVPFPFGKGGSGVLANCSLCDTEATLSFSAGPAWSSFSAEACAILPARC